MVRRDRAEEDSGRDRRAARARDRRASIAEPDVKTAWDAVGIVPQAGTSAALGERIARDIAKWRSVASGIKIKSD